MKTFDRNVGEIGTNVSGCFPTVLGRMLKEIGATDDLIAQYQRYMASGNRQGQERVLCRCRRMKNEILKNDRGKLACLDYIIARVEKTDNLFESN